MGRISFIPSKQSVEVREPDGDVGVMPGATAAAAGVMTADYVRRLEEIESRLSQGAGAAPVIIERGAAPDMSQYMTKSEVRALLVAMQKPIDMTPEVSALRGEVAALHAQLQHGAQKMLAAPAQAGEVVDERARAILDGALAGFESLDQRLRAVEAVFDRLSVIAEVKGHESAA